MKRTDPSSALEVDLNRRDGSAGQTPKVDERENHRRLLEDKRLTDVSRFWTGPVQILNGFLVAPGEI